MPTCRENCRRGTRFGWSLGIRRSQRPGNAGWRPSCATRNPDLLLFTWDCNSVSGWDVDKVERDIEREVAKNGGMTTDAALARFALAFAQKTPRGVADYLARHHQELATQIDKKLLLFRQVEMLAQAGFTREGRAIS